jgi:pimeloyl-ACP methyl ester carboxylesterase
MTKNHYATVYGSRIFCRAAGVKIAPTIWPLQGFPTSPHGFHDLIPALADSYRLVAPNLPGFGFSDAPANKR